MVRSTLVFLVLQALLAVILWHLLNRMPSEKILEALETLHLEVDTLKAQSERDELMDKYIKSGATVEDFCKDHPCSLTKSGEGPKATYIIWLGDPPPGYDKADFVEETATEYLNEGLRP